VTQEVKRGSNTALANRRLIAGGLGDLPDWRENLAEYLEERAL